MLIPAPMQPEIEREMERCHRGAKMHGLVVEVTVNAQMEPLDVWVGPRHIGLKYGRVIYEIAIKETPCGQPWATRGRKFELRPDDVGLMVSRLADCYEYGNGLIDFQVPFSRPMLALLAQIGATFERWKGYRPWVA